MIKTRETPKIMSLEIKPIEKLDIPEPDDIESQEEELPVQEVNPDDEMFKRVEEKPKKKKMLSEKQKKHMEKMRKIRAEKRADKKALEEKIKQAHKQQRLEELKSKVESQKPVKMQIPEAIKKELPKQVVKQVEQTMPEKPKGMSNKEYMKEFFNNLNLFMDSYNKLSATKKNVESGNLKKADKKSVQKKGEKPESFSFRNSMVSYRNVRNPFNF